MTVSLQSSPYGMIVSDRTYHSQFPFQFPQGDPGIGAGGSSSITVEIAGVHRLAWASYGATSVQDGGLPPAGLGYPSQPSAAELQSATRWWPHGFHHWGYTSYSKNFGFIASSKQGLTPNGDVTTSNFCFTSLPNMEWKWRFLSYSSVTNDGSPYTGNANAWWKHLGYDVRRLKDLVIYDVNRFYTGSEDLAVYEISNTIPATRGTKVWQGTNGDRAAGLHNKFAAGVTQIQIPWLGVWWFIHIGESTNPSDVRVFQWAPTASPASSSSGTRATTDIYIPDAVKIIANNAATNIASNLHFVVDHMGQRVFAYQRDVNNPVGVINGLPRYPLLIWEVNPSVTPAAWTQVNIPSPLNVSVGNIGAQSGKLCQTPMAYRGGFKFLYLDPHTSGSASYGSTFQAPGNWQPTQTKYTGGLNTFEIFIPKASQQRTMTWTKRTWTGSSTGGEPFNKQKHVEMTFNSTNGRMYCFGGDHGMGTIPDSAADGEGSGYNNQLLSFSPETGNDLTLEASQCPLQRSINHPIRVDENGFQYRASSNDFWMMPGYSRGNGPSGWFNHCGWASWDEWTAAGGGNDGFFRWSSAAGWAHSARNLNGSETLIPDSGFSGRKWIQGEDHCRRWYYDSGSDSMIASPMGYGGANGDAGMQAESLQIMSCTPSGANYLFRKYSAHLCWNGLGGNKQLLPDGRPFRDTVSGAIAMWNSDRSCVNPVTGYMYQYNAVTGDVFRIHTRSNFWSNEGLPAARVEWIFRIIPSGANWNLTHLIWAKNALWIFVQSGMGLLRVFSWAEGETAAIEHGPPEVPNYAVCTSAAKYTSGADERICLIGNETSSSFSTVWQANLLSYWTITLA